MLRLVHPTRKRSRPDPTRNSHSNRNPCNGYRKGWRVAGCVATGVMALGLLYLQGGMIASIHMGSSVGFQHGSSAGAGTAGSGGGDGNKSAIIPIDLTVNHLPYIPRAPGALPEQVASSVEDFLPIVLSNDVEFRFRLAFNNPQVQSNNAEGAPITGTTLNPAAIRDISSYRIMVETATGATLLWDSGRVNAATMPYSIPWGGPPIQALQVGTICKWRVQVWDGMGEGPSTSHFSKFAVGPSKYQWHGQWISHPVDLQLFGPNEIQHFWPKEVTPEGCNNWKRRRPLPMARAKVQIDSQDNNKKLVSALLVVSGLGSFQVSFDGKPLSSSSPLDPPLTDFTERVSYRGYDVTSFFSSSSPGQNRDDKHVVGITLGSGWWDPRPLKGGIIDHGLFPRGALTTIAELHLTYQDGTTQVKIPTGKNNINDSDNNEWQIAKGYILDSDLYTGEVIDLGLQKEMEGWNTPGGWTSMSDGSSTSSTSGISWVQPILYKSDATTSDWRAMRAKLSIDKSDEKPSLSMAPIGKLIPSEIPPVLPIERIPPESVRSLGDGRWLYDFGKAISGVVRFDEGLPTKPMKHPEREKCPRGHYYPSNDDYVTVVYGDSLEMETGDINRVLVAGHGLHDSGPRVNNTDTPVKAGPCFPEEHGFVLTQRDVFIAGTNERFADARQALFTTHGFRFAEVCCFQHPPRKAHAILYRSAVQEWGKFDSSNRILNGAYELTRNAFNSNMQGVQSDCPHREKLQYGGDIVANSPAAMHMFDLGAFYSKVIHDWADDQFQNGAYTATAPWYQLLEEYGIGKGGAGETVWATSPAVLTVRHMQHYHDTKLLVETFMNHQQWIAFLKTNWNGGDWASTAGLGDWLSVDAPDSYLAHHAFFMASARSVAYLANRIGTEGAKNIGSAAMALALEVQANITAKYIQIANDGEPTFKNMEGRNPGIDIGLFARIVPGTTRCSLLKTFAIESGSMDSIVWPGDEEILFLRHLKPELRDKMLAEKTIAQNGVWEDSAAEPKYVMQWRRGVNLPEGILTLRYTLKALSDSGFHQISLNKATGVGYPSFEYMLSHNATAMWETWWRSEDVYSRNHPMLGAVAEWLSSSVAGIALSDTTTGGKDIMFWPRIPTSALQLEYASATQGTKRGDAAIAWRFLGLPTSTSESVSVSATVKVHIRLLVPPSSNAVLRVPTNSLGSSDSPVVEMRVAKTLPDLDALLSMTAAECVERRAAGKGFSYNWEYDLTKKEWDLFHREKSIGTPCQSFLFHEQLPETIWGAPSSQSVGLGARGESGIVEISLDPGLYDLTISDWELSDVEKDPAKEDAGPYCTDKETFEWTIDDASHII